MGFTEIFVRIASVGRIKKRTFGRVTRQFAGIILLSSVGIVGRIAWNNRPASRQPGSSESHALSFIDQEPNSWEPQWLEPRRLTTECVGVCHMTDGATGITTYCDVPQCDGMCVSGSRQAELDKVDLAFVILDRFVTIEDPDDNDEYKLKNPGWIIIPIFGILYMFAGLAIVCDEFFVPALECFVDEFGISMDVAGATFMAAGGSMPELFTSFLATFQESQVGFAAIVGSAVFNVLFVIAVCAIFAPDTLSLTWWPLARDCSCYLIALITVAIVFKVTSPNLITWVEALVLLLEYFSYCAFMKKNQAVYRWVEGMMHRAKVIPVDGEGDELKKTHSDLNVLQEQNINFKQPSKFRKGIVQLLTANTYLYETAGIAAVTQISGNLEETFKKLDKDNDGTLNIDEVKELLKTLGMSSDGLTLKAALKRINRTGEDEITFEAFKRWYIASETRIEVEINRIFTRLDKNNNNAIEKSEIKILLQELGETPTEEELEKLMEELSAIPTAAEKKEKEADKLEVTELRNTASSPSDDKGESPIEVTDEAAKEERTGSKTSKEELSITREQFEQWYTGTLFYQKKKKKHDLEEDAAEQGICLTMPDEASKSALLWYFFTYPLCAAMYCTLPDVRTPKFQRNYKIAILEFTLSLGWIGIFSQVLFECTVVFSNTIGIPPTVAAVTLLAGGTSIPDLLSSYIVARNGEGDMAVSSSIGSNIFDVTVGLPLPWLTYSIVQGIQGKDAQVAVVSASLGLSLIVLILMLAAVITTIICCKWKLTKTLGYIMLVLYLVFIAQDLSNQFFGPFEIF